MGKKKNEYVKNIEEIVFDIENMPIPKNAWWWWFWLFFIDDPKKVENPRQLMILWSTKNEKKISCNDLDIVIKNCKNKNVLDGAVAAWYFDGKKMHHNFLLEQCRLVTGKNNIISESKIKTLFSAEKDKYNVKIGKDFNFIMSKSKDHDSYLPTHNSNNYIRSKGYSILRMNRLKLGGEIKGKDIVGTAYFQRVFVNALSPSWYWGIFHFENGGILSYFNPRLLKKSVKKDITFFDGKNNHKFSNIKVKRVGEANPEFYVSGENENGRISFIVDCYSHSSWTFKKKSFKIFPNKLVYNEYPAKIAELNLEYKKEKITLDDLGYSIGNVEHSTGLLL